MKKLLLILSLTIVVIGCKKEPDYPIYTKEEKVAIYKEARDNNNEEKLKEINELMKKLEILGKKGDNTALYEQAEWHEVKVFYIGPKKKDPGANVLNRKW